MGWLPLKLYIIKIFKILDKLYNVQLIWFVGFNIQNFVLCIDLVSLGTVTSSQILPMNVFRNGVWKGATHAILVYNHPGGVLYPSKNDIKITDRLYQCGKILHLPIKDYIIISMKEFFGFKDEKLMRTIAKSIRYVPQYKLKQRWRKEGLEIRKKVFEEGIIKGRVKGRIEGISIDKLEEKIEIAKRMLADNIDINIISKHTEFSEEEIIKTTKFSGDEIKRLE